jgi:2,4-dienoyl-CoA reductase-like NADH-dependent reductase (Old Yellow Enzyme family)
MEIIELTRAELPEHMPLILRISATDLLEESLPELPSWKVADTVRLAEQLVGKIDLLDVSSGGNHVKQRIHVPPGVAYQAVSPVVFVPFLS